MSITGAIKRRGRPATGRGESINVRLQPDQLAALDEWVARQASAPSRPEAIRHALAAFLAKEAKA
ncbi:ribbon-helix-helix domain-containing protein [Sphingomonas sp. RHCKR47]|uniref:ribbon-helix-helix domain-containing protein n=1 Tax=Sphingomonas citricola TaxID=2862498 RepID=UPI001C669197|nr:ribbon-helix-helix domain-containing protein [Sphingomonas citricola]MBW6523283.1 ribbon-helix-helix domain-containing protein [Sphingomonas citricola]